MSDSYSPAIQIASLAEVRGDGMEACILNEYMTNLSLK
jgi:hypothetical protein